METPLHQQFAEYQNTFGFALKQIQFDKTVFFSVDPVYSEDLIFTCYDEDFIDYLSRYEYIKYFIPVYNPMQLSKIFIRIPDEIKNHPDKSLLKKARTDLIQYIKKEYQFQILPKEKKYSSAQLPNFL